MLAMTTTSTILAKPHSLDAPFSSLPRHLQTPHSPALEQLLPKAARTQLPAQGEGVWRGPAVRVTRHVALGPRHVAGLAVVTRDIVVMVTRGSARITMATRG
jgi:hypothetical protein